MAATKSTQEWVTKLVDAVPRLRPVLQEHERLYDEVLPHLFFGEVAPWAENELATAGQSSDLLALLDIVDQGYISGDAEFRNVLEASFVEDLGEESPVLDLLGPHLSDFAEIMFPNRR
jgi:hypothetical protein